LKENLSTLSEIVCIRKGDPEKVLVEKDALVLIIYPEKIWEKRYN
jgi:hypothetical protein